MRSQANETIEVLAGIGALDPAVRSRRRVDRRRKCCKVGLTSLFVAVLGVAVPFALGWGVGAWLLPDASPYVHAFLGATLTATSVGITARVLQDLGWSRSPEARIILGAAVIDDVLGLIILGAVGGAIAAAAQGRSVFDRVGGDDDRSRRRVSRRRAGDWHDGGTSVVLAGLLAARCAAFWSR